MPTVYKQTQGPRSHGVQRVSWLWITATVVQLHGVILGATFNSGALIYIRMNVMLWGVRFSDTYVLE